jgi:hypothetical protein
MTHVEITTITTTVPTSDDDNMRRMQKLAERDEDLRALRRTGYRMCSTVPIPTGDSMTILDTLERDENQQ